MASAWLGSENAERRSEFLSLAPRPLPPPSDISRWDLADILNPPSGASRFPLNRRRNLKLSMDFVSPNHHQPIFSPQELDSSFSPNNIEPEHSSYELFGSSSSNGAFGSQYRRNASSNSSIGQGYGMNGDGAYSQQTFNDSVPFTGSNGNSYDMINSLPSSYSSGKISPLTPNDPVHPPGFPPPAGLKEYGSQGFHDFNGAERRIPGILPSSYQSDLPEDYVMGGVSNGLSFSSSAMQHFQERLRPYQSSHSSASGVPPHITSSRSPDILRTVPPQVTHSFRPDNGVSFEDVPSYMGGSAASNDMALRMSSVDEQLARVGLRNHPMMGVSNDLQTFIRPYLDQYVRTPNRLAFGERTVIVMSSKVAQKSYGTEKRFLCPPPTAIMIGNSWWTDVVRRGDESKLSPPRVVISISGEPSPQEGTVEWTGSSGKSFDVNDPPTGTTYIGRCVGKQLFISDVDEKKKKVEALVKITSPATEEEPERMIGTFPSRPIKVISKPSKKRQSAKNLELCINHGSTISLFHRLRSQTVSTKYLCVSGSGSSFKGSDGAPLMGLDQRTRASSPSFIARTASWDPFVMYIVDVNKPAGGIDAPPPPPPQPDYPSPPPNAIPFTNNGSQIPIYYNQTVVLQCLTSGVVSPVLIIRKVDHQTTVVGGGLQDGAKGVADHYCAPGEVCGDPVSQLHKIAFEVYDGTKGAPAPGSPGVSGAFLSCMGEKVNTYRPIDGRQWNAGNGASSPTMPGSPLNSTGGDYFSPVDSAPGSPSSASDLISNDGGRVKKKRSTSSAGATSRNVGGKNRRRPSSAGSMTSSTRRGSSSDAGGGSGALWQVDIGETSVWTIVGTDQVRYNFYVPPVLFDNQHAQQTGSFPVPSKPVTPFPGVVKYLPPDRASEAPKTNCPSSRAVLSKPNPHQAKMLTLYGENFSKTDPVGVYFGADPSPYVEVRCTEVLGCLPPEGSSSGGKRRPIILIRADGVVFPSSTMYP
ncbi:hypothetical protein DFS33DRAFT_1392352 [Desarmillaria ectypa]|nr:hypothetical protein DFS33DRAFT_1392352 [Desarmillaria ectypa]